MPVDGIALFEQLTQPEAVTTPQQRLRRLLVERDLRTGDRLPSESDLVSLLGSTRLLVREALLALEALGLLESRAGSGWFVRRFDVRRLTETVALTLALHPRVLLDLLAVRRAIEADFAAGVAGALAPADQAVLTGLVERMRLRAARGESFHAEDTEFHRRIVAAGGNAVALAHVDLYCRLVAALYERGLPRLPPVAAPAMAEFHARILDALKEGDGAAAAHLLRTHHDESCQRIGHWLGTQEAGTDATDGWESDAARAAVNAALLWPGPLHT